MNEAAKKNRDARFRRSLLSAMREAMRSSPSGFISGELAVETANAVMSFDQKVEDPGDAIQLLRDLVSFGLALEKPGEALRRGERFGLKHVRFLITQKGIDLLNEAIDPVKGVWDERLSVE